MGIEADDARHSSTHAEHCSPGDRPPATTEPARFSARQMIGTMGTANKQIARPLAAARRRADMADTVFETRGHYLFSWTFPTPRGAKTIEQLRFLFSVALPDRLGFRYYMQHFWFDQKLANSDEPALATANNALYITWAKGSGLLFRTHRMVDTLITVAEFMP